MICVPSQRPRPLPSFSHGAAHSTEHQQEPKLQPPASSVHALLAPVACLASALADPQIRGLAHVMVHSDSEYAGGMPGLCAGTVVDSLTCSLFQAASVQVVCLAYALAAVEQLGAQDLEVLVQPLADLDPQELPNEELHQLRMVRPLQQGTATCRPEP